MAFEDLGCKTAAEDTEALIWLKEELRKRLGGGDLSIVEIGTFAGHSALVLAKNPNDTVYCVDTWRGGGSDAISELYAQDPELIGDHVFKVFCKNVKDKLLRQIFPVHMPSALAASIWPFKVDMVWIDANHEFAAVRDDILGWMPHVRKGGLICGHDYAMTIWECDASGTPLPGGKVWRTQVKPAVDLLIPDAQLCGKSIWYKFL